MKNYEKPMVMVNESVAEGVYAASGDCWTTYSSSDPQPYVDGYHIFQIICKHDNQVGHDVKSFTAVITFNDAITAVENMNVGTASYSGNTVSIIRNNFGNGENIGDTVEFKVKVSTGNEATTKALAITGISYSCETQALIEH